MALPTGSGTETIHAHSFQDIDGDQTLIFGVQHHVYTVLSIIVYAVSLNATTDKFSFAFVGYDGHAGASQVTTNFANVNLQAGDTYVWNDKFSFNGVEPTTSSTVLSAAQQIQVAAQSGSAVQQVKMQVTHASDDYDVLCTYLDQDWT